MSWRGLLLSATVSALHTEVLTFNPWHLQLKDLVVSDVKDLFQRPQRVNASLSG